MYSGSTLKPASFSFSFAPRLWSQYGFWGSFSCSGSCSLCWFEVLGAQKSLWLLAGFWEISLLPFLRQPQCLPSAFLFLLHFGVSSGLTRSESGVKDTLRMWEEKSFLHLLDDEYTSTNQNCSFDDSHDKIEVVAWWECLWKCSRLVYDDETFFKMKMISSTHTREQIACIYSYSQSNIRLEIVRGTLLPAGTRILHICVSPSRTRSSLP